MASGRLRLNRQLQQPPAKSMRIAEDNLCAVPPLEATSHWILNDRVLGQLHQQAGGRTPAAAAGGTYIHVHDAPAPVIAMSASSAADVIFIGSSQEEDSSSGSSFVSQGADNCDGGASQPSERAADSGFTKTSDESSVAVEGGRGQHAVAAAAFAASAVAHHDDDAAVGSEEQFYTFGEEEELLSQAAVARWQLQPEAHAILDDGQHETHPQSAALSPAQCNSQELLAFLALHNLDAVLPTLLAHEVASVACMCMLTHSDISCATPPPLPLSSAAVARAHTQPLVQCAGHQQ